MLKNKKVLIAVSGSIAAYKITYLVRLLKRENALVKVIMTNEAKNFITPLTLATLSENPVHTEFYNKDDGAWNNHVELSNWADIMVIAPATANTIAKMALGIADNLVLTTYLSAKCHIFIAPAMDANMFHHPATQKNIEILNSRENIIISPKIGELASGLCGEGRMEEPEEIVHYIKNFLSAKDEENRPLKNKIALVTAGPTYEKIDPVRFIGNFSSGKMGFALANELALKGAKVKLITGPTNLLIDNPNIERFDVVSTAEMYSAVTAIFPKADIIIMNAAVSDYTPIKNFSQKLKRKQRFFSLKLKQTIDILASMGKRKTKEQILGGFALETEEEIKNAKDKLKKKNLDFIVLCTMDEKFSPFGSTQIKISIINRTGKIEDFPLKEKTEAAKDIVREILRMTNYPSMAGLITE